MVVGPLENMQRTRPRTVGVYPDRSQIPIEDPNPVGTRSGRVGSLTFPDLLVRPSVIETFPLSVPHPQPPLLLHKRIFRFSLTRRLSRNKIMRRFSRLRRDSRFIVRMQFL